MAMLFDSKLSLRNQIKKSFVAEHENEKGKYNVGADAQTFQELHPGEIDHYISKHTRSLQRSNYVSVENDQGKETLIFTADELKNPYLLAKKENDFINEIEVNFKKTKDVERRQFRGLFMKAQFLYKLQTFKKQGRVTQLMNKIGYWLERNMDKFYTEDTSISDDDNMYLKMKEFDKVWRHAETII